TAVFETAVNRTTVPLRCAGSDLELAVDHGQIRTRGHREPVSEIRIGLKRGDPSALGALARRIARSLPVSYAPSSKPQRGYALCREETVRRAGKIVLDPDVSAGNAFRMIGRSCLSHALANRDAVCRREAEGVHQMRVGLRRLRAAISIFGDLIAGTQTETIKGELKWLTEQLGAARELEVLLGKRIGALRKAGQVGAEAGGLGEDMEVKRDRGLRAAAIALRSDRYRELGLQTAL